MLIIYKHFTPHCSVDDTRHSQVIDHQSLDLKPLFDDVNRPQISSPLTRSRTYKQISSFKTDDKSLVQAVKNMSISQRVERIVDVAQEGLSCARDFVGELTTTESVTGNVLLVPDKVQQIIDVNSTFLSNIADVFKTATCGVSLALSSIISDISSLLSTIVEAVNITKAYQFKSEIESVLQHSSCHNDEERAERLFNHIKQKIIPTDEEREQIEIQVAKRSLNPEETAKLIEKKIQHLKSKKEEELIHLTNKTFVNELKNAQPTDALIIQTHLLDAMRANRMKRVIMLSLAALGSIVVISAIGVTNPHVLLGLMVVGLVVSIAKFALNTYYEKKDLHVHNLKHRDRLSVIFSFASAALTIAFALFLASQPVGWLAIGGIALIWAVVNLSLYIYTHHLKKDEKDDLPISLPKTQSQEVQELVHSDDTVNFHHADPVNLQNSIMLIERMHHKKVSPQQILHFLYQFDLVLEQHEHKPFFKLNRAYCESLRAEVKAAPDANHDRLAFLLKEAKWVLNEVICKEDLEKSNLQRLEENILFLKEQKNPTPQHIEHFINQFQAVLEANLDKPFHKLYHRFCESLREDIETIPGAYHGHRLLPLLEHAEWVVKESKPSQPSEI